MAKTKALISFAVTAKLICVFVLAYADCWFSHEVAHLFLVNLVHSTNRGIEQKRSMFLNDLDLEQ